jgi:hypothetical protein
MAVVANDKPATIPRMPRAIWVWAWRMGVIVAVGKR